MMWDVALRAPGLPEGHQGLDRHDLRAGECWKVHVRERGARHVECSEFYATLCAGCLYGLLGTVDALLSV